MISRSAGFRFFVVRPNLTHGRELHHLASQQMGHDSGWCVLILCWHM